jgi:uncharacterized protein YhhL (DUF1145 family)
MIAGTNTAPIVVLCFVACYALPSAALSLLRHTGNALFAALVGGLAGGAIVAALFGFVPAATLALPAAVVLALSAYGVEMAGLATVGSARGPMTRGSFAVLWVPQLAFALGCSAWFVSSAITSYLASVAGSGLGAAIMGLMWPQLIVFIVMGVVVIALVCAVAFAPLYLVHHRQVLALEAAAAEDTHDGSWRGGWRV